MAQKKDALLNDQLNI